MLLSRRWLVLTCGAAAAIALFVFLGRWQWDTAMARSGTLQNLFYAFNWWIFAALVVYGWAKTLHEDLAGPTAQAPVPDAPQVVLPALYRRPRPAGLDEPVEDDPELAAYNAYLAELDERSSR